MTQLLIMGAAILAQGPFTDTGDSIESVDAIYPKHVIDGWQIVDAVLPDGFAPAAYTWDGLAVVAKPPVIIPPIVPQSVTMRQARLALSRAGLLATVDAAIANMTGSAGDEARIEWEFSSAILRGQALVAALAPVLGMTDAQLDQLFIAAAAL